MVLFVMLDKVFLTFESVVEILVNAIEQYFYYAAVFCAVQVVFKRSSVC